MWFKSLIYTDMTISIWILWILVTVVWWFHQMAGSAFLGEAVCGDFYALRPQARWGYDAQCWRRIPNPSMASSGPELSPYLAAQVVRACWTPTWLVGRGQHGHRCVLLQPAGVSRTAGFAHLSSSAFPRKPREALVAVSTGRNGRLKNIFYTLFVIGANLCKSYLELGKVLILTHYHSRTRLCHLVQPVLSFRNQKPCTVRN